MTTVRLIEPDSIRVYREPFPYFTAKAALGQDLSSCLLRWLEFDAGWNLVEADFYEQYELCGIEGQLPECASFLRSPAFLKAVRHVMEGIFKRSFKERIDWTIHKLLAGQRIRLHNDFLNTGETHRLIIHLNRGWSHARGGFLMLFNSSNPVDVHRVLMPLPKSVIGFEISEKSNHAVSRVVNGQRFAVVYSLYADRLH